MANRKIKDSVTKGDTPVGDTSQVVQTDQSENMGQTEASGITLKGLGFETAIRAAMATGKAPPAPKRKPKAKAKAKK